MLGHLFATREYGSPAAAVGKPMNIDGMVHTIVGVLPSGVTDLAGARTEVWIPLQLSTPQRRGPFSLRVIARLKD